MDGELSIYNKHGGGTKYKIDNLQQGGDKKITKNQGRIQRIEKRIKELQEEKERLTKLDA